MEEGEGGRERKREERTGGGMEGGQGGRDRRGEGRVRGRKGRREILRDYIAANSSVSSNALYC